MKKLIVQFIILFVIGCSVSPKSTDNKIPSEPLPTLPILPSSLALPIDSSLEFLFQTQTVKSKKPKGSDSKIISQFDNKSITNLLFKLNGNLFIEWIADITDLTTFVANSLPSCILDLTKHKEKTTTPNFYFEKDTTNNKYIKWYVSHNTAPVYLYIKKKYNDTTYWLQVFDINTKKDLNVAVFIHSKDISWNTIITDMKKKFPNYQDLNLATEFNSQVRNFIKAVKLDKSQ